MDTDQDSSEPFSPVHHNSELIPDWLRKLDIPRPEE